ncbi:MAG: hypothetical protein HZA04_03545 [Nitrospinae bacterium]|nr:hypothetical protein [Nitrospinota bacterium]
MPKDPDKEMENLSKAIVEAILGSGEVKHALEKLGGEEAGGKNFMVFMLSLDSLADAKKREVQPENGVIQPEMPKPRRKKPAKKNGVSELIDGKPVTPNEKKFHDFVADQFDSESWLKNLRLRLE